MNKVRHLYATSIVFYRDYKIPVIANTPKTKNDLISTLESKKFTRFEIVSDITITKLKRYSFNTNNSQKISAVLILEK